MGGGRTAHFGLCVAIARSCVGLKIRAGPGVGGPALYLPTRSKPALGCQGALLLLRRKTTEAAELDLGPSPLGAGSSVAVYSWAGAGTGNFKQNAGLSRSGLHHFEVETQVGRMHRSLSPRQTQFDDFQFMALRMQKKKMIEICEY